MLGFHRGPLAVDLGIGIGGIEGDELDIAADRINRPALAARLPAAALFSSMLRSQACDIR